MEEPNLSNKISQNIGFIGGGNMAKAICEGIVTSGLVSFQQIHVSGPRLHNLTWWKDKACNVSQKNGDVFFNADIIFISVKPHILHVALDDIKQTHSTDLKSSKIFVSILAGVTIKQLKDALTGFSSKIIRVMPNTPMTVGEGCTIFTPHNVDIKDIEVVQKLLSATGLCRQVPENLINAAGALTACGPAFIYMTMEALADGAVKMGIPRDLAREFASQMTLGAAKMARDSGKHTGQLKDEVCSPGGTTIQGVYALEKGGIRAAFMDAIEKATNRCAEISDKI